jgi:hypothetical protein
VKQANPVACHRELSPGIENPWIGIKSVFEQVAEAVFVRICKVPGYRVIRELIRGEMLLDPDIVRGQSGGIGRNLDGKHGNEK